MSERRVTAITCDHCGKTTTDPFNEWDAYTWAVGRDGWESHSGWVAVIAGAIPTGSRIDLCSWNCLKYWAAETREEQTK